MISLFDTIVQLNKILGGQRFQKNLASNLKSFLKAYQIKIDQGENLKPQEIAEIALDIVTSQYFNDRNHRTALLFCYFYYLINNRMLRIKPYQFYAAIKFAEEKFLKNNSIQFINPLDDLLFSTCYSTCTLENQIEYFESIKEQTLNLHEILERLFRSKGNKDKAIQKMSNQQLKSYERHFKPIPADVKKPYVNLPQAFPEDQRITALILGEDQTQSSYIESSFISASKAASSPLTVQKEDEAPIIDPSQMIEEISSLNEALFDETELLASTIEASTISQHSIYHGLPCKEIIEYSHRSYLQEAIIKAREVAPSPLTVRSSAASPAFKMFGDAPTSNSSRSLNGLFSKKIQGLVIEEIEHEPIDFSPNQK